MQLPTSTGEKRRGENAQQKQHDHLAPKLMEVDGLPFVNVSDIGLLPEHQIKWVSYQPVAERVDKERSDGCSACNQQFFHTLGCVTVCFNQSPLALCEPGDDENCQHYES